MTPAEFRLKFPEFDSVVTDRVQSFIDQALPHLDVERWGDFYAEGIGNLVAHYLALAAKNQVRTLNNDPEDDAIMKKAGDSEIRWSEKVAVLQITKSTLLATPYGQQYMTLRKLIGLGGVSV